MARPAHPLRPGDTASSSEERLFSRRHGFVTTLVWVSLLGVVSTGLLTDAASARVLLAASGTAVGGVAALVAPHRFVASLLASAAVMTGVLATAAFTADPAVAIVVIVAGVLTVAIYKDWRLLVLSWFAATVFLLTTGNGGPVAAMSGVALLVALSWRFERVKPTITLDDQRLRLAFDEAPVAMAMLKPSGEIVAVNGALVSMLGRDDLRLRGSNIRSVIHTDDRGELGRAWEEMANGQEHRTEAYSRALTDEGTAVWCRMSFVLVPWDGEQPALVILQIEDMSHSHQAYRDLQELASGKDAFIASVLDEAVKPLDLVIDLTGGTEPDLAAIVASTREATSIIDMLRQSAHLASGDARMWSQHVDLATICRDAAAVWEGRVRVEVSAEDAWADPTWLSQIVTVLIGHSVRFGGPHVRVSTKRSGPDTLVLVSDDGPALPEAERVRVFDSDLSNARPVTDPVAVGLGLTVSRRLARQMDGDLVYRRDDGRNILELRVPTEEVAPADVA